MAPTRQTIREGLMVGVVGSVAAAVFYAVFDVLAARGWFFTVDMLGKSLFRGMNDPAVLGLPSQLDLTAAASYSVLHVAVSLIIGLVVVGLVAYSERRPSRRRLVLVMLVGGFLVTIASVALLTSGIRSSLPFWSIVVANSLAVVVAGTYLLRRHPGVWRQLTAGP